MFALTIAVCSAASLVAHAARSRSVEEVVSRLRPQLRPRLVERFRAARAAYPPPQLTLIAYKQERRLEVWAPGETGWVRVLRYPILAASGERGPKLREGDYQVPEGVYSLTGLNPSSKYHLSIRVGYPNLSAWLLAWSYWEFYRVVERLQDHVVIADFSSITSDYASVIAALNERFATSFVPYRNGVESDRAIFEGMLARGALPHETAAPNAERAARARGIAVPIPAQLRERCEGVYVRLRMSSVEMRPRPVVRRER